MPRYESLRTLAFQFPRGVKTIPRTGVTLAFPEAWKALLTELHAACGPRSEPPKYLPTWGLNGAMRTLVADLVGIQRYADAPGEHPWLVSETPIDPTALLPIIHAWVRTAFDRAPQPRRDATLAHLMADALRWQPAASEMKVTTADNGTAILGGVAFQLLPDQLAARLSQPGDGLEYGETKLTFRRVLRPAGASGTELMSWPPLEYKRGRDVGWFSITIMITVQTIPFCAGPQVYCNLGIRRWISRPATHLGKGKTTLYLHTSVPWITGLSQTPTFGAAQVQWVPIPQEERGSQDRARRLGWSYGLGPLLADLHLTGHFPDPNAILADPGPALNRDGRERVTAALVYSTDMTPLHLVGPGLMPADRRPLAEQIAARFAPLLTFTEPAPRVSYHLAPRRPRNPFFPDPEADPEKYQAARRSALAAVADPARLEVWYQSETMRDAVTETLAEEFGLIATSAEEQTWTLPEGTITLHAQPLGRLGSALDLPTGRTKINDKVRAATQARTGEISATLPPLPDGAVAGALVELIGKKEFDNDDPKNAIRGGFAATNRLTQFLTPVGAEDDLFAHRIREALRDLLRQFGVQPVPLVVQPKPQPGQAATTVQHYVGAWLVKEGTKNYAVLLVDLPAGRTTVRVHLPGHSGWLSYPAAHLALAQGRVQWRRWPDEGQTDLGMLQELAEVLTPLGDTLLLVEATNLRRAWPWLQNGGLTVGSTNFGTAQVQRLLPHIRLVRMRGGLETPQWYAQTGTDTGFAQGLFQLGLHVFASTHAKSGKFQKIRVILSKAL